MTAQQTNPHAPTPPPSDRPPLTSRFASSWETRRGRSGRRRGVILLVVLVVVVVLALSAYTFCDLMLSHYEAAQYAGKATQARLIVDSAIDRTRLMLTMPRSEQINNGGFYQNPQLFQSQLIVPATEPADVGMYTVLAPMVDEQGYYQGVRYGLEDLSTRLNLNYLVVADTLQEGAGRALLMTVPGMSEDIADAVLDYIDSDDEPRELGAESEHYSGLGYSAKNGPLDTVDELLEVRDVTPTMLYGLDVNRNGMVDVHEQNMSQGALEPGLERGWAPYLTIHSKEANLASDGLPRVFLNEPDLQLLSDNLEAADVPPEWITYILAYRSGSPYTGEDEGEMISTGSFDLAAEARTTISQVLDLVASRVQVTFDGDEDSTILASPAPLDVGVLATEMPIIMDKLTVNPMPELPGRININQAPRAVMLGIPGMTEDLVDLIIEARADADESGDTNFDYETWLLTQGLLLTTGLDEDGEPNGEEPGLLDLERMKTLSPYICARGQVYSAQIVGFYLEGAVSARSEVIFDATSPTLTVLRWRDLSHLGRGFPVDVLSSQYTGLGAAGGLGGPGGMGAAGTMQRNNPGVR